jgi:hypothetical protein
MTKEIISSILGWIFTLISMFLYGLWIYESSRYEDFMEGVAAYKSHFAPYLQGRWDLTYIQILLSFIALFGLTNGLKTKNQAFRIFNIIFLIPCCAILGLAILSFMQSTSGRR